MKQYRLIEITRKDDKRHGKLIRTRIFVGLEKAELKKAIHEYYDRPERKPWVELAYYYGAKRLYAYDL